ncbi:cupin domain-containing protein [Evansella cellulosilytica]|uniref:Cupin 2 conserved barrel domain protein n=1 Tax=Evansella cellulosilytica (strain ATCC 21833 / DSM 2522 / FERM P-1141 / JCM 9156 / N-4) TaxID=649639 RepID=E6U200_EVAC2|nr:cupin domain-containing protein [Evansella cellulosilytica]ADU29244.1 Cupin 2 conserved barrel domain protein [Evansella cellulosilytica DSM 2522]
METATKDRSITHAHTGEVITFLENAKETNGEYLLIEVNLPPGGEGPPLHYHLEFEEEFEGVKGQLFVIRGKEEHVINPGEKVTVPKETHHLFKNASDTEPVTFRVKLTPPHKFEESMRIAYGLAADGKISKKGKFDNMLHAVVILNMQDTRLVKMPFFVRFLFNRMAKKAQKQGIEELLIKEYIQDGTE